MIDGLVQRACRWQPEVVISSDLQRCRLPAEAISSACGVVCEVDPVWREIYMGEWENQPWAELQAKHPEALDCVTKDYVTVRAPGGESYEELADRTFAALQRLEARPEQRLWVMTHGGVIRTVISRILGLPLKQSWAMETAYACGVLARWSGEHWKVVFN